MREIVTLVKELRGAMEDVDLAPQMAAADARKLRQSVLKAAFEGRLVGQDPRDESAKSLLVRLNNGATQSSSIPTRRGRRARVIVGAEA
jgi:type I restriction enzyme S subunit